MTVAQATPRRVPPYVFRWQAYACSEEPGPPARRRISCTVPDKAERRPRAGPGDRRVGGGVRAEHGGGPGHGRSAHRRLRMAVGVGSTSRSSSRLSSSSPCSCRSPAASVPGGSTCPASSCSLQDCSWRSRPHRLHRGRRSVPGGPGPEHGYFGSPDGLSPHRHRLRLRRRAAHQHRRERPAALPGRRGRGDHVRRTPGRFGGRHRARRRPGRGRRPHRHRRGIPYRMAARDGLRTPPPRRSPDLTLSGSHLRPGRPDATPVPAGRHP